jgi:hypothetical protein
LDVSWLWGFFQRGMALSSVLAGGYNIEIVCFYNLSTDMDCLSLHAQFEFGLSIMVLSNRVILYRKGGSPKPVSSQGICGKLAGFANAKSLHYYHKSLFFTSSFLPHHFFSYHRLAMALSPKGTMHDDPWQWHHYFFASIVILFTPRRQTNERTVTPLFSRHVYLCLPILTFCLLHCSSFFWH